ncbi:P-selectin isoform X2 [Salminus brasiliensis]|uniref:P-selectin isoform X2 n=1 Tax=Salminus brasiliensis TaxID=930266 RepID=UPI003B8384BD
MFFMRHIRLFFGCLGGLTIMVYKAQAWTYHYQTENNMDWKTARQWCQNHYTDMVAIQNQGEITYLNQVLPFHRQYYWIGIRKVGEAWTWVGTRKTLTDEAANWAKGEPNNQGSGEDCVEIYIKRDKDTAKWNDERCSKKKASLCYKVVQCPPITSAIGRNMNCSHPFNSNSYSSTCTFSCEEGFELVGSHTTQCDHTGQWTHMAPACTAVMCDPLVAPANGNVTCTDPLAKFSFRSSCAVTCEGGYTLKGESTLTCLKTGNWSAETPACEVLTDVIPAVSCGTLMTPNGHVTCTDPLGRFSFRSSCTVTCEKGYTLRGESTLTCLEASNWSAETPTCEAQQCPLLFAPENGWINCSHPRSSFSYGSHCRFGCKDGHVLTEEPELDCTINGSWTQEIPSCDAVQCKPLSYLPLAQPEVPLVPSMNCLHPKGNFSFGSQCMFQCSGGYRLNGSSELICTSDGTWTALLPTCIAEEMPLGTGLLVYTAIGAGSSLGGLLAAGLIVLAVRQFSKKAKFTPDNLAWEGDLNPAFDEK